MALKAKRVGDESIKDLNQLPWEIQKLYKKLGSFSTTLLWKIIAFEGPLSSAMVQSVQLLLRVSWHEM